AQFAHVQMVATGWVPIGLWGLHRYFRTAQRRWLAVFSGAWILQALSNSYAFYFMAVAVGLVMIDGVVRLQGATTSRAVLHLGLATIAVAAALAPVGAAYYRVRSAYGQVRSVDEMVERSATLKSYVVGKRSIGIWRRLPTMVDADPEKELFPGIVVVLI